MGLLSSLAGIFGIEVASLTDKLKREAAVLGAVAFLAFVAVVFLLVAGYIALAAATTPLVAALVMAGSALLLAVLVYGINRLGAGARERADRERRRRAEANTLMATAAAGAIPGVLRSPLGRALGIPVLIVAGLFLLRGSKQRD